MGQVRIRVDLSQGIIEAEGDESFVTKMYGDFKEVLRSGRLAEASKHQLIVRRDEKSRGGSQVKPQKSSNRRRISTQSRAEEGDASPVGVSNYKPTLDKNLDTSKLDEFMTKYVPRNSAEYILLYAKFLEDVLEIAPCNVDQIYTCFRHAKTKLPTAFGQVFINARGDDYGYIDFTSPSDITISVKGVNHINHGIKRAKDP